MFPACFQEQRTGHPSYQAHKRSKDAIHCIVEIEMAACKERVSIGQATGALGRRILVSVEYR